MMDELSMRKRTREAIRAGELPDRLPDKLFGGVATGGRCAVCGESTCGGIEIELIYTTDGQPGRSYYAHPRCLSIFEREVGALIACRIECGPRAASA